MAVPANKDAIGSFLRHMTSSRMRFRNVVLLAAVASCVSFVRYAMWFFAHVGFGSQSYGDLSFGLLTTLVQVLFFCFLYFEASEWIRADARAITAVVLSILMVLRASGEIWHLALGIYVLRRYHIGSVSDLLIEAFYLLGTCLWLAFLMAFSSKKVTAMTRLIPTVSGVLALFAFCSAVWTSVQLYNGSRADPHVAMLSWNYLTVLFGWAALSVFYVEIWRRWKRDLPIQQNVVC